MLEGQRGEESIAELCRREGIADLVLWLFRQSLAGSALPPQSTNLLDHVFRKAWQSDFSFAGVARAVEEQFGEIMCRELAPEQEAAAAEMQAAAEGRRHEVIALYERDGKMPYER